jgi:hypothetical protein
MSISEQCRRALKAAKEPLNCAELLALCDEAENSTQIAQAMFAMNASGEALRDDETRPYRYRINPDYTPSRKRPGETDNPAKAKKALAAKEPKPGRVHPRKMNGRTRQTPQPGAAGMGDSRERPAPINGSDCGFGINDAGHLGISKGEQRLELNPAEFARLRTFIDKTDTLWSAA